MRGKSFAGLVLEGPDVPGGTELSGGSAAAVREEKTQGGRWCSLPGGLSIQHQTLRIDGGEKREGCNADQF